MPGKHIGSFGFFFHHRLRQHRKCLFSYILQATCTRFYRSFSAFSIKIIILFLINSFWQHLNFNLLRVLWYLINIQIGSGKPHAIVAPSANKMHIFCLKINISFTDFNDDLVHSHLSPC